MKIELSEETLWAAKDALKKAIEQAARKGNLTTEEVKSYNEKIKAHNEILRALQFGK